MPRTKGSKNKPKLLSVDERIATVTTAIEALQKQIKDKKAELKKLNDEKKLQDQKRLLDVVAASGKSPEEILALIDGTETSASV